MGNKVSSPFPTYEVACAHLNQMEISHLKKSFKTLCRNSDSVTLSSFITNCQVHAATESYIRKHILPRLFAVMDGKKDNVLDFEEYVCAVALFRIGTTEEKIRVLFMMYEPFKGLHLQKESLRRLLVDATVAIQKEEVPVATLELWILEQIELSECMADMALLQFSNQEAKLDLQEFVAFVKVEGSIQGLLLLLPEAIDS